jgi:hypothetical protein
MSHPPESRSRNSSERSITDRLTKSTGVVIQAGVLASMVIGYSIWMHQRVNYLELQSERQGERDKYIMKQLDDVISEVRTLRIAAADPVRLPNP